MAQTGGGWRGEFHFSPQCACEVLNEPLPQALGDMPLRTCKTILQQVVTVFGRRALQELEDMDMADTSFVGAYLNRLLQGQHSNTDPRPVAKSAQVLKATDESQSRSPPATGTPTETQSPASQDDRSINQQLKEIFDAIGQPETSKQVGFRLVHLNSEFYS